MLANTIITYIMAAFAMLGAIDRIIGNKLGLGKKFEQAFLRWGRWCSPWWECWCWHL